VRGVSQRECVVMISSLINRPLIPTFFREGRRG
jgi:hypothetical protein